MSLDLTSSLSGAFNIFPMGSRLLAVCQSSFSFISAIREEIFLLFNLLGLCKEHPYASNHKSTCFFKKGEYRWNYIARKSQGLQINLFSLIRKPSFVLLSLKFCLQFGCKPNFVHLKPRKYAVIYKGKWYLNPCWEGKPWSCVLEKVCNDLYRCPAVPFWQCHQARLERLEDPPVSSPNPVN